MRNETQHYINWVLGFAIAIYQLGVGFRDRYLSIGCWVSRSLFINWVLGFAIAIYQLGVGFRDRSTQPT